jgi:signal transduction histidine kinase
VEWLANLPSALLTPIAVVSATDGGTVRYANAAFLELLAVPDDAVLGRPLDVLIGDRVGLERRTNPFPLPSGEEGLLVELQDVGEQRRVEQELAELARFPEMNPGPVLHLDLEGTILLVNRAARRVFGDDLVGSSWHSLISGMDADTWQRVIEGEEIQHEAAAGDAWYVLDHMRSPDGTSVFVFGADITDRRAAEQQIRELARFPDMNPGPVLRVDAHGTILLANRAAQHVFGEVLGASWLDVYPTSKEHWSEIVDAPDVVNLESKLGERNFVFAHRADPQSQLVFVYGTDITAQRAAEQQIRELARFPDMNPGPVLRVDTHGTILLANRAAQHVFGEVLGASWLDVYPTSKEHWPEIVDAPDVVNLESKLGERNFVFAHRADPQSQLVFVYGTDITVQRKVEQALRQSERMATLGTLAAGVAHELNNPAAATRRAAEQLREAIARLEDAYRLLEAAGLDEATRELIRSLDEQARGTATQPSELDAMDRADREDEVEAWLERHAVSEPWTLAGSLVAQGLDIERLDRITGTLTGQELDVTLRWAAAAFPVYRLAHEIGQGSARISEIVGALKGYTFLDQAPEQLVNIHEALDNTLVILNHKLNGVQVVKEYAADLPPCPALASELNEVWTNLLDNAVDALGGDGTITLRTYRDAGWAVVEITDDGPGIPPDIQHQVFDRFFTTKEPGMGTGLGLATVHTVVTERHHGEITLTSNPGATCFTVRLPLQPAAERVT